MLWLRRTLLDKLAWWPDFFSFGLTTKALNPAELCQRNMLLMHKVKCLLSITDGLDLLVGVLGPRGQT